MYIFVIFGKTFLFRKIISRFSSKVYSPKAFFYSGLYFRCLVRFDIPADKAIGEVSRF